MVSLRAGLRAAALLVGIAALAIQCGPAAAHRTVSASLSARWGGTPVAWEVLEFMVRCAPCNEAAAARLFAFQAPVKRLRAASMGAILSGDRVCTTQRMPGALGCLVGSRCALQ